MATATTSIRHEIYLTVGGLVEDSVRARLIEMEIDTTLGAASMFMLRFNDHDSVLVKDKTTFKIGQTVKIEAQGTGNSAKVTVIEGEITSIEPSFSVDGSYFTIRGYDKRHRLTRGSQQRVFVNSSHSDIVSAIASDHGLSATVESTSPVYDHVYQDNQSDYDFIKKLAHLNGYQVGFSNSKLLFKKAVETATITASFGEKLKEFRPRMNAAGIPSKVTVKGWSPDNSPTAIVGTKSSSTVQPSIGDGSNGISTSKSSFSEATATYYIPSVKDQSAAEKMAQALLDYYNSHFIEADGMVYGMPDLLPGKKLKVEGIDSRFAGTYTVSAAQHRYYRGHYEVHFRCEGASASLLSDMLGVHDSGGQQWSGVVPAIVTNIKDDDLDIVRVKVKYPWMDDQLEGHWARMSSIGVGASKSGIHWLPQVNDEVLIAFEGGDFNRPYVLGGLWNGSNKAPQAISTTLANDKVSIRTIQTPAGHIIRLTDKSGEEKIEIIDAKEGTTMTFDGASKGLTIKSGGDISIEAEGKVTLKSGADFDVDSGAKLNLKGSSASELSTSAALTIKGSTVKIN